MTVKPQLLAILLKVVAVVELAGTVTFLVVPVFFGQKLVATVTFGDPIMKSKSPREVQLARADSNEVTLVLYWKMSFGIDAIFVDPLNTDLKLVTSVQTLKNPCGMEVKPVHFSNAC